MYLNHMRTAMCSEETEEQKTATCELQHATPYQQVVINGQL